MSRIVLLIVIVVFLGFRLPPVLRQAGGPDEEWYAIPGLTIAREGVPRVPYSRATETGSVFLGAERLLFAMPPLSFYAQAPFFLIMPPTYATARLASLAAGCVAILLVYAIGRTLWDDQATALWGAGIYSACRLLYFPAMIARPDMLCGTLGLAAVWAMCRWSRERRRRWLALAGVLLGLAGLSHPFAIVFALQLGIWAALASGTVPARPAAAGRVSGRGPGHFLRLADPDRARPGAVSAPVHRQHHRTRRAGAGVPAPVSLARPRADISRWSSSVPAPSR